MKVPTWINGIEATEYVGVGARFGPTLESKEKHATHTRVALADPPDCCSTPKNRVGFSGFYFHLDIFHTKNDSRRASYWLLFFELMYAKIFFL